MSSRFERLADDLPVLGVLELDVFRHLQLGRGVRNLAVGRLAARRRVRDHARFGLAFRGRHLPRVGRGRDQHLARRRAALAHVVLGAANAAAAARRHVAPDAVARQVLARRRHLGLDLLPVALELFGHQLGQPGQRALAHLRARDADDDIVVRADEHPGADLVAVRAQHLLRQRAAEPRQMQAERQTAAGGRTGDEHLASRDLGGLRRFRCHDASPVVLLPARAAACALTGGSHFAVAGDYGSRNEASMGRTSRTFAEPTVGQRQAIDLQAPAICSM